MTRYIEVCVRDDVSTTERGRVLERFARRFLETQNYGVVEEVRITGMEVDLLAEERTTGERIIVECKAQRSTLPAEVIMKLLGKVSFEDFSSGWLISTHDLGKDAKGVRSRLEQRSSSERKKLQIYDPESLTDRLIAAGFLKDPSSLALPDGPLLSDDVLLILSQQGVYWAMIGLDDQTRMRRAVYLYDAHDGRRVSAKPVLTDLASTDTSLANLSWEADDTTDRSRESQRLTTELQSVVRVQSGDHWADYRPARPDDYVGRESLLNDVLCLFDLIRSRSTSTRVFAIKGPSGWGKSSSVLKIADRAGTGGRGRSVFVYAVDSRAATSRRFVELALYRAFKEAVEQGFVHCEEQLRVGGPNAALSTSAIAGIFRNLAAARKTICLIFDQFEELLYKEELSPIFEDVRLLCDAAIEAGEGFVVGFSWKTDGAVPPEHNAYHLWHSLSDRRREFELSLFSAGEVTVAINRFAKELGQPISAQLRRLLLDHCQGYPWLLKKLCIHILEQVRGGLDQSEVLVRTLRIDELFSKDIEKLSEIELACIKQVASEAPAEFFKIISIYNESTISSLLDKRLIIRTGSRLSIYWDIFRDYLLNEKVPYIPTTYIPQLNIVTYLAALRALLDAQSLTYQALANELGVVTGTADNLVRDMVIVGHAEANRKTWRVNSLHIDAASAANSLSSFCQSHALYRGALDRFGVEASFSLDDVVRIAAETYSRLRLTTGVLEQYSLRIMQWCVAAGLLDKTFQLYSASKSRRGVSGLTVGGARNRRGRGYFLGDAPPERTLKALKGLIEHGYGREQLTNTYGKNTFESLCSLGFVDNRGALLPLDSSEATTALIEAARSNPSLVLIKEEISKNPTMTGVQLGEILEAKVGATWSRDTQNRNGNSIRRWVGWAWSDIYEWRGNGHNRRLYPKNPSASMHAQASSLLV